MAELKPKKGDNGQYGYVDENDNWVIEPKFEEADDFCEYDVDDEYYDFSFGSLARVKVDGKGGLIDEDGEWFIKPGDKLGVQKFEGKFYIVDNEGADLFSIGFADAWVWGDYIVVKETFNTEDRTESRYGILNRFIPDGLYDPIWISTPDYNCIEDKGSFLEIWQDGDEWRMYPDGKLDMYWDEDDK